MDIDIDIFQNHHIDIDIDIFGIALSISISISIFFRIALSISISISIFSKNDHIDIDIDIDIFQKCRYFDNRYVISIYRTGLFLRPISPLPLHCVTSGSQNLASHLTPSSLPDSHLHLSGKTWMDGSTHFIKIGIGCLFHKQKGPKGVVTTFMINQKFWSEYPVCPKTG